jgi:hypothetical protein
VDVRGEGFCAGAVVFFGDAIALEIEYIDSDTLRVVTPPGSGIVDVTVASAYGQSVLSAAWTYSGDVLAVDRLEPAEGAAAGGYDVVVHGSGLDRVEVWFDGIPAVVRSRTSTEVMVTAPPHEPGSVPVLVTDGITEVLTDFRYVPGAGFVRGDVDAQGDLAINDAILILSILFAEGSMPSCMDRADVNDDGSINIADAVRLLGYLFGGEADLPPPFPEEGPDPTPDELPCS